MQPFLSIIFLITVLFSSMVVSSPPPPPEDYDAIDERTQPVGQVRYSAASSSNSSGGSSGAEIYDQYCFACHTTGLAGSPRLGVAGDWTERLKQGKETLYKHAIGGLNSMPMRGACMSCSDEDIMAAVDYMLDSL